MMSQFHNVPRIIDDPGHQVAYFVVVKELEIQRMQMGEQIPAHAVLHVNSHNVAVIIYKILAA